MAHRPGLSRADDRRPANDQAWTSAATGLACQSTGNVGQLAGSQRSRAAVHSGSSMEKPQRRETVTGASPGFGLGLEHPQISTEPKRHAAVPLLSPFLPPIAVATDPRDMQPARR